MTPEVEFSISKLVQHIDSNSTMGIVAKHMRHGNMPGPDFYSDILHHDEVPVEGSYERVFDLAQEFANNLGHPVYAASVSCSGGVSKVIRPEDAE